MMRAVAVLACALLNGSRVLAYPFQLTAGLGLSEEFNDNVYFQDDEAEPGERDLSDVWDFITHIGLGLTVNYQRPTIALSLTGGTNINLYARETRQNTIDVLDNQALTFHTAYQATPRLSFTIADSIARVSSRARTGEGATEPISDPGLPTTPSGGTPTTPGEPTEPGPEPEPEPPGETPTQTGGGFTNVEVFLPGGSAFTNRLNLGAVYLLTQRWSAGVGYANHIHDFADPDELDVGHSVSGHTAYQWSPTLSVNARYSYSGFLFTAEQDANVHNVSLGANYQPSATTFLSGSGGVFHSMPRGGGQGNNVTDRTGFSGGLHGSKIFERSSASIAVRQGLRPSGGVNGLALSQQAFANYTRALTETLSGSLGASFGNFDTDRSSFRVLDVNAGLGFPIWRDFFGQELFGALTYRYRWRQSDDTFENLEGEETLSEGVVDGNSVSIRVGVAFPLWQTDL
jgi:hypothetical protein